ncbi:MAG: dTDP-4-dehydrorhamnose 3,5-epimerase family protein [Candidatus Omnitrophica bacterium]|nr:dTDP-4-dehydrorhamnose 3,5-epimerase family protein [Candidatus Omnitrophota bacterium]
MLTVIEGVEIKELAIHKDERGFFCEVIRNSDNFFQNNFAQLSCAMSFTGVAKAWHLHRKQTDWMCTLTGDMKLVLYDTRETSKTHKKTMEILMGETHGLKVVKIPPGVAHGYKVINGPMYIVYVTNREYDSTDELRIPHDDPEIGYDWRAIPPIK